MARFELNIYGEGDEVLRRYEADRVRWGVLVKAVGLRESLRDAPAERQIEAVGQFLKEIFTGLTDEDLAKADYADVLSTFGQLVAAVGGIKAGEAKNG